MHKNINFSFFILKIIITTFTMKPNASVNLLGKMLLGKYL